MAAVAVLLCSCAAGPARHAQSLTSLDTSAADFRYQPTSVPALGLVQVFATPTHTVLHFHNASSDRMIFVDDLGKLVSYGRFGTHVVFDRRLDDFMIEVNGARLPIRAVGEAGSGNSVGTKPAAVTTLRFVVPFTRGAHAISRRGSAALNRLAPAARSIRQIQATVVVASSRHRTAAERKKSRMLSILRAALARRGVRADLLHASSDPTIAGPHHSSGDEVAMSIQIATADLPKAGFAELLPAADPQ